MKILIFSLWAMVVIGFFHKEAFSPGLRYTRIAEGNISHSIHRIWNEGFTGFRAILESDAVSHGRIRPGHWLFYNLPFVLTLVRNGDLFPADAGSTLGDRINGDLQTHALFLLACLSLTCGSIGWFLGRIAHSVWIPLLFPIYFASFYAISENLIVYNCDSQEIPQLLFISLYFASIALFFHAKTPKKRMEFLSVLFLFAAYSIKETSVVLMPAFLLLFALRYIDNQDGRSALVRFGLRQSLLHMILVGILIFLIQSHKQGGYVGENYKFPSFLNNQLVHNLSSSWLSLQNGVPWAMLAITSALLLGLICLYELKGNFFRETRLKDAVLSAIFLLSLSAGFWAINLPWQQQMAKYYLPVVFFASAFSVMLQIILFRYFFEKQLTLAASFWMIGSAFFMLKDIDVNRRTVQRFYTHEYAVREFVDRISLDIVGLCRSGAQMYHAILIAGDNINGGRNFQEGPLPIQRHVNLIHGVNIADKRRPVHHIPAIERNYFRIHLGAKSVEIKMNDLIPTEIEYDMIYWLGETSLKDMQNLHRNGFTMAEKWVKDRPDYSVKKFQRAQG